MIQAGWRSQRVSRLGSAIFAEVAQWRETAAAAGRDIIDLGIGSPDQPPDEHIRAVLAAQAMRTDRYRYPASRGSIAFREEAARWLQYRFDVKVDPEHEVLALMGTQDGLAHLALAVANPGDRAIVPDPGYPIYAAGLALAGVEPIYMPLASSKGFLPDLDALGPEAWEAAVFVLLNVPGNPVAARADKPFFEKLVAKAKQHNVLLVHDLAYSEMGFDGYRPSSVLEVAGAKEIAIEFHSLSKSFNLAGCRIGFVVGNAEALGALRDLKANIDYGIFEAIQETAIAALAQDRAGIGPQVGRVYETRRNRFVAAMDRAGWPVPIPPATMFVWAPLPESLLQRGWTARRISREIVRETGVVIVPGDAFGKQGEGYVRIALVEEAARLEQAAERIGSWLRQVEQAEAYSEQQAEGGG